MKRVGFKLFNSTGPSARQHMKVFSEDGSKEIGEVTSGCLSPTLKEQIGMAYLESKWATLGNKLQIQIRNKKYDAVVCRMPFVKTNYFNV